MPNREDDFLQQIRENPGNHELKLAYGRWLDEQTDARGEYIRLTYFIASLLGDPTVSLKEYEMGTEGAVKRVRVLAENLPGWWLDLMRFDTPRQ